MKNIFTKLVDRTFTNSLKFDRYLLPNGQYRNNFLPLWIADTDFETSPAIIDAINTRLKHKLFGYYNESDQDKRVLANYLRKDHNYDVSDESLILLPGLLSAMSVVCRMAIEENGSILTNTPVYPPFMQLPQHNRVPLLTSPLKIDSKGLYRFDFDHMKDLVLNSPKKVSWLFLCNPQNPTGRVFSSEELTQLSDFCEDFGIKVLSDEVHCDLVWKEGTKHNPFGSIKSTKHISLYGPGKTFNIAGLGCSFAVIEDPSLRQEFYNFKKGIVPHLNTLGIEAMKAAYEAEESSEYKKELLNCLRTNYKLIKQHLKPTGSLEHEMEATFLAFINSRKLMPKLSKNVNPTDKILEEKSLALNDGSYFGQLDLYKDYSRLNFATPTIKLTDALQRLTSLKK